MRVDVVSIVALIASIGALFVSVQQAKETYEINRLLIRPLMGYQYVYTPSTSSEGVGVYVANTGNGTAIVYDFKIEGNVPEGVLSGEILPGAGFRPDERYSVLFPDPQSPQSPYFRVNVSGLRLSMCYCDIGEFACWKATATLPMSASNRKTVQVSSCAGTEQKAKASFEDWIRVAAGWLN